MESTIEADQAAQKFTEDAQKFAEEATKRIEENTERVKEFNATVADATKTNGRLIVDSYEKAAKGVFDVQRQLIGNSQIDWVKNASATQIQFAEDVANAWVKAARELLK